MECGGWTPLSVPLASGDSNPTDSVENIARDAFQRLDRNRAWLWNYRLSETARVRGRKDKKSAAVRSTGPLSVVT